MRNDVSVSDHVVPPDAKYHRVTSPGDKVTASETVGILHHAAKYEAVDSKSLM